MFLKIIKIIKWTWIVLNLLAIIVAPLTGILWNNYDWSIHLVAALACLSIPSGWIVLFAFTGLFQSFHVSIWNWFPFILILLFSIIAGYWQWCILPVWIWRFIKRRREK